MAIPINGAVQGLAINTAKNPVAKAPIRRLLIEIRPRRSAKGFLTLIKSNNKKNTITNITNITATKTGDCSWKPQRYARPVPVKTPKFRQ